MKVDIIVPTSGESVNEAIVAQIMKDSGTFVKKEEEILELETDKVNQIVYAPETGIIQLTVSIDDKVTPNEVIGFVNTDVKKEGIHSKEEPKPETTPSHLMPSSSTVNQEGIRRMSDSYIASINKKEKMSPSQVVPSKVDVSHKIVTDSTQSRKRMSGLRRTIAKRLVEVKNNTAMLTTFNEVDMTDVMEIRSREKETFFKKHGVKLGFMSFFVKACTFALKESPDINAFIDGDEIVYNSSYNVGISVSTPTGLMVPVLRNAEKLSFSGIEKGIQSFAKKAREGAIAIDDLQGGTFTITNGGVFGSMLSTPILNPPQSAILGMHNILKRPVVVDDKIVIRHMMYVALSYDHRIIDGKEGVTFLVKIKELLEKPERLLLEEIDG